MNYTFVLSLVCNYNFTQHEFFVFVMLMGITSNGRNPMCDHKQAHNEIDKSNFVHANTISEFGVATAHPNDAFCVGIKISISIHSIQMEIFIPTKN